MSKLDITTIILTYNEEIHIRRALENVCPIAKKVLVIDSPSTDRTCEIAREFENVEVVVHKYPGNQATQFNWALDNCEIDTEWILRLDADEYLTPDLIKEMQEKLPVMEKDVSAVVLPLGRAFMGRVLKHGIVNGVQLVRIIRKGKARYEERLMDEYLKVTEGRSVMFEHKFVDDNRMTLRQWIDKHNNYSTREMITLLDAEFELYSQDVNAGTEFAEETKAKRAQKAKYAKMPLFWRSIGYFCYRYFAKLGFLDGKEGFCWDFFQGLWYRMTVDAKIYEVKKACGNDKVKIIDYLNKHYMTGIKSLKAQMGGVILRFKLRDESLEVRDCAAVCRERRMAA